MACRRIVSAFLACVFISTSVQMSVQALPDFRSASYRAHAGNHLAPPSLFESQAEDNAAASCHLPLHLWRPFAQKLAELLARGRLPQEVFDRIVTRGLGISRIDAEGEVVIVTLCRRWWKC